MGKIVYKEIMEKLRNAGYNYPRIREEKILSQSIIQRIRNGESITLESVATICETLGCRIEDIVEIQLEQKVPVEERIGDNK